MQHHSPEPADLNNVLERTLGMVKRQLDDAPYPQGDGAFILKVGFHH